MANGIGIEEKIERLAEYMLSQVPTDPLFGNRPPGTYYSYSYFVGDPRDGLNETFTDFVSFDIRIHDDLRELYRVPNAGINHNHPIVKALSAKGLRAGTDFFILSPNLSDPYQYIFISVHI